MVSGSNLFPFPRYWPFWDLNEIRTTNHFYGSGMSAFMGVVMVSDSYLFSFPRYCPKRPFWLPTHGLSLDVLGSEETRTPKYFNGSGMTALTGVNRGF